MKITNFLVLLFDHDNDLVTRKTYIALRTHSTLRGELLDGLLRLDIYFLHSYMSDPSERASVALRITILQEHTFDCLRFCAIFVSGTFRINSASSGSANCAFRMLYLCNSSGSLRYLPIYLHHSSKLGVYFYVFDRTIAVAGVGTYFPVTRLLASLGDGTVRIGPLVHDMSWTTTNNRLRQAFFSLLD